MQEVVVTGFGAVTPVGLNAAESLENVFAGKSGIALLPAELTADIPIKIGAQVKGAAGAFEPLNLLQVENIKKSDLLRLDSHAQYGVAAGLEALKHGFGEGFIQNLPVAKQSFAVYTGSSQGAASLNQNAALTLEHAGPRKVPPGVVIFGGADSSAAYLSMIVGAEGSSFALGATCASGANALGEAMRAIRHGYLDTVLVVGADDCLTRVNLAGNANIRSLTQNYKDQPEKASRPFDKDRAGFVMGQGAAAILLESKEQAQKRGAEIIASLVGYGSSSDAYHATAPHPEGKGAVKAMLDALKDAHLEASQIQHVNAHATSTPHGDKTEVIALQQVFGAKHVPPVTATKSVTGHMLGAAGVFEAIVVLKSLETGYVPPTLNLDNNEFDIEVVTGVPKKIDLNVAMTNSFGFGGHNATLIFKR